MDLLAISDRVKDKYFKMANGVFSVSGVFVCLKIKRLRVVVLKK